LKFVGFHFPNQVNLGDILVVPPPAIQGTVVLSIDFARCTFHKEFDGSSQQLNTVFFNDAIFLEEASFEKTTFNGTGMFRNTVFRGMVSFADSVFKKGGAIFDSTVFHGNAIFYRTEFNDRTVFAGSVFKAGAGFFNAKFNGVTTFDRVKFEGQLIVLGYFPNRFDEAVFAGSVDFSATVFVDKTSFRRTRFSDSLVIRPAPSGLNSSIIFDDTQFDWSAEFDWSGLENSSSTLLILRGCRFREPNHITLRGPMGCVSMLRTDVTRVDFVDENWRPRQEFLRAMVGVKSRRAVLEEYILERMTKSGYDIPSELHDITAAQVVQLYRRLRENYETNKRYAEAGDFFIGEMDVSRKYKTVQKIVGLRDKMLEASFIVKKRSFWDPYRLFLLEPYHKLSLYGESVLRPTIFSVILILVFAWFRWPASVISLSTPTQFLPSFEVTSVSSPSVTNIIEFWDNFKIALLQSIFAYFQLVAKNHIDLLERLFSIPLLGLIFIAVRRKLERR